MSNIDDDDDDRPPRLPPPSQDSPIAILRGRVSENSIALNTNARARPEGYIGHPPVDAERSKKRASRYWDSVDDDREFEEENNLCQTGGRVLSSRPAAGSHLDKTTDAVKAVSSNNQTSNPGGSAPSATSSSSNVYSIDARDDDMNIDDDVEHVKETDPAKVKGKESSNTVPQSYSQQRASLHSATSYAPESRNERATDRNHNRGNSSPPPASSLPVSSIRDEYTPRGRRHRHGNRDNYYLTAASPKSRSASMSRATSVSRTRDVSLSRLGERAEREAYSRSPPVSSARSQGIETGSPSISRRGAGGGDYHDRPPVSHFREEPRDPTTRSIYPPSSTFTRETHGSSPARDWGRSDDAYPLPSSARQAYTSPRVPMGLSWKETHSVPSSRPDAHDRDFDREERRMEKVRLRDQGIRERERQGEKQHTIEERSRVHPFKDDDDVVEEYYHHHPARPASEDRYASTSSSSRVGTGIGIKPTVFPSARAGSVTSSPKRAHTPIAAAAPISRIWEDPVRPHPQPYPRHSEMSSPNVHHKIAPGGDGITLPPPSALPLPPPLSERGERERLSLPPPATPSAAASATTTAGSNAAPEPSSLPSLLRVPTAMHTPRTGFPAEPLPPSPPPPPPPPAPPNSHLSLEYQRQLSIQAMNRKTGGGVGGTSKKGKRKKEGGGGEGGTAGFVPPGIQSYEPYPNSQSRSPSLVSPHSASSQSHPHAFPLLPPPQGQASLYQQQHILPFSPAAHLHPLPSQQQSQSRSQNQTSEIGGGEDGVRLDAAEAETGDGNDDMDLEREQEHQEEGGGVAGDYGDRGGGSGGSGIVSMDREEVERPKKRRMRVALSCAECKRRKIKCDRAQPCTPCSRRGDQSNCKWAVLETKDGAPTRAEFDALQQRLTMIERVLSLTIGRYGSSMALATGAARGGDPNPGYGSGGGNGPQNRRGRLGKKGKANEGLMTSSGLGHAPGSVLAEVLAAQGGQYGPQYPHHQHHQYEQGAPTHHQHQPDSWYLSAHGNVHQQPIRVSLPSHAPAAAAASTSASATSTSLSPDSATNVSGFTPPGHLAPRLPGGVDGAATMKAEERGRKTEMTAEARNTEEEDGGTTGDKRRRLRWDAQDVGGGIIKLEDAEGDWDMNVANANADDEGESSRSRDAAAPSANNNQTISDDPGTIGALPKLKLPPETLRGGKSNNNNSLSPKLGCSFAPLTTFPLSDADWEQMTSIALNGTNTHRVNVHVDVQAEMEALVRYLPSKESCDFILGSYLDRLEWQHCVLHPGAFHQMYKTFWSFKTHFDRAASTPIAWLALLLIVMSHGLAVMRPAEATKLGIVEDVEQWRMLCTQLWIGAERALALDNSVQAITLEVVQTLVLLCYRSISLDPKGWFHQAPILAMAARLSMCIGLGNVAGDTPGEIPPPGLYRRELWRRIWANVVYLDWRFSVPMGETYLVNPVHFNAARPANLDWEDMEDTTVFRPKPRNSFTSVSMFLAKVYNADRVRELCDALNAATRNGLQDVSRLLYDHELAVNETITHVPPCLIVKHETLEKTDIKVQWARIGHALELDYRAIQVHRPFLVADFRQARARSVCVDTAEKMLDCFMEGKHVDAPSAWWWYGYTASVVLLMEQYYSDPPPTDPRLSKRLDNVIDYVAYQRNMDEISTRAMDGILVLETLLTELQKRRAAANADVASLQHVTHALYSPYTTPMQHDPALYDQTRSSHVLRHWIIDTMPFLKLPPRFVCAKREVDAQFWDAILDIDTEMHIK